MPDRIDSATTPDVHRSPEQLSAYHDDELDPATRFLVEQHLFRCSLCHDRLAEYRWLRASLRDATDGRDAVPPGVSSRLAARLEVTRRSRRDERQVLQPFNFLKHLSSRVAWAPAAALALFLVALLSGIELFGLPLGPGIGGPTAAVAYPCDDPHLCAVAVRFNGSVDHAAVERSFQIEPPIPVTFAWQGDTLLVKPATDLARDQHYTVRLQPDPAPRVATPVVVAFVAGGHLSPVAVAPGAEPTDRPAPPTATRAPATPARPSPTAVSPSPPAGPLVAAVVASSSTPTPTVGSTATATRPVSATIALVAPVACAAEPDPALGAVLAGHPDASTRLGCAKAPGVGVGAIFQQFARGQMIWLGNRREIVVAVDGGGWQSVPDTYSDAETVTPTPGDPVRQLGKVWRTQSRVRAELGSPAAPEQIAALVIEEFDRGRLVSIPTTAGSIVDALYADGSWQRFGSAPVDPAATPLPSVVPISPTLAPSWSPTLTPTLTTSPAITPTLAVALGQLPFGPSATPTPTQTATAVTATPPVPTAAAGATQAATVTPSGTGTALPPASPSPTPQQPTVPTTSVTPTSTSTSTPTAVVCGVTPASGFEGVYRRSPSVAQRLGCATAVEASVSIDQQSFDRGLMLERSDTKTIYTLLSGGPWSAYPDTWQEGEPPAPIPTPPAGHVAPAKGFGKLWSQSRTIQGTIGWALGADQAAPGTIEPFVNGLMLRTADRQIYVLFADGSWERLPDRSVEQSPSGS